MAKRLETSEGISTRTVNDLSEKEKMIQEQAKLIELKKKRLLKCLRRKSGLMQRWQKG